MILFRFSIYINTKYKSLEITKRQNNVALKHIIIHGSNDGLLYFWFDIFDLNEYLQR